MLLPLAFAASGSEPDPRFDPVPVSGGGEAQFLHPDRAFVPSAERTAPRRITAAWDIAPGYYLYRKQLAFTVRDAAGEVVASAVTLPPGVEHEDAYFGRVETYRERLEAAVELTADPGAGPLDLDLRYQGCADAGLCYPPIERRLRLGPFPPSAASPTPTVPALAAAPLAGAAGGGTLSEQDRATRSLAEESLLVVLVTFYGFGLLLSLTPCVLPMVPILSSIIVGQGGVGPDGTPRRVATGRCLALSAVYVSAMALTYALAGVAAGVFGRTCRSPSSIPRCSARSRPCSWRWPSRCSAPTSCSCPPAGRPGSRS